MPLKTGNKYLDAKASAVDRFLGNGKKFNGLTAFAASTKPEHNVVGVGIGPKVKNGKLTARRSVRFYVERKVPEGSLSKDTMIPKSIRGVPTDVIETGRFRALSPIAQTRLRPARGGCSVGFKFTGAKANFVMAGTFGALVSKSNGKTYILSNNHVLANENALPIGSPIFQCGLLDNGDPQTDQIAKLTKFVKMKVSPTANRVDAAIAELLDPSAAVRTVLPKVGNLKSTAPKAAAVGMKVHKHGRTTGYRRGQVVDTAADVNIEYDFGVARFTDQIVIVGEGSESFSDAGDSGSLIVDRSSGRATGLLFAGSATHTIANHIADVLSALKVSLL